MEAIMRINHYRIKAKYSNVFKILENLIKFIIFQKIFIFSNKMNYDGKFDFIKMS